jgi:hypothetical protein
LRSGKSRSSAGSPTERSSRAKSTDSDGRYQWLCAGPLAMKNRVPWRLCCGDAVHRAGGLLARPEHEPGDVVPVRISDAATRA